MNPSARLFFRARCHCQVIICRRCDQGQVYCAAGCAEMARAISQNRAAKRYHATHRGRRYEALPRGERVAVLAALLAVEAQELA